MDAGKHPGDAVLHFKWWGWDRACMRFLGNLERLCKVGIKGSCKEAGINVNEHSQVRNFQTLHSQGE